MSLRDDNSVFASLQTVSGVRYNRAEYNRDIIDTFLLRKARQKGVRLPTGTAPDEYKYLGAHVETPTAGMSHNVVYIDVSSMYPSSILSLNASPETIVGTEDDLRASPYTEDDCVWGYIDPRPVKHLSPDESWQNYTGGEYKIVYDPEAPETKWTCDEPEWSSKRTGDGPDYTKLYFLAHETEKGFLTECVEELIALKNQYRGTSLYGSTKRVTNSVYGVTGFATEDTAFRLFDWRLAEAITLCGRKMIQFSRDYVLDYLAENGHPDAYAALGDTDGVGIALPSVSTRHEAMSLVEDAVAQLNGPGYDGFFEQEMGVPPENHHGEIEIESYAPKVFVPSKDPPHDPVGRKKRYIQWETWNDDDGECDEISITGLEAIRSDVAPITQDAQQAFAETLRLDDGEAREQLFPQLRHWAESIQDGEIDLDYVCKRGGIGQSLDEYGTASRRASTFYRGAKYANRVFDTITIQQGDKPRLVHVSDVIGEYPSVYDADTAEDGDPVDAVTVPDPSTLPETFRVNWDTHWIKSLKEPMRPLLETRGWSWSEIIHEHEQSGLNAF